MHPMADRGMQIASPTTIKVFRRAVYFPSFSTWKFTCVCASGNAYSEGRFSLTLHETEEGDHGGIAKSRCRHGIELAYCGT